MNAPIPESTPERDEPRSGRLIWLMAVAIGAVGGLLFLHGRITTPSEGTDEALTYIGWTTLVSGPWIIGVLAGIFRPYQAVRTSLLMSVVSLLVFAPLAGEGAICVIFIAPWFLVVAPVVALVTSAVGRWRKRTQEPLAALFLLLLPSGALWLEERFPTRVEPVTLSNSVIIDAPLEQVWDELATVDLSVVQKAPVLVRALLPQPLGVQGEGAHAGAERRVIFHNGVVLARVIRSEPPLRFEMDLTVTESGKEFFDHWARLGHSTFVLEPLPDGRTRLTHATSYEPRVTVRWYSDPIERRLGHLLQGYVIEAFAEQLFTGRPP
ncbi:MAG TPA: hypothetical protein VF815_09875, partial [Myxococcaceae bacterium]